MLKNSLCRLKKNLLNPSNLVFSTLSDTWLRHKYIYIYRKQWCIHHIVHRIEYIKIQIVSLLIYHYNMPF